MRKGIQLLVLLALWIGLTLAILRPAFGQEGEAPRESTPTRPVFWYFSLLLPGAPSSLELFEVWGRDCRKRGGADAKLALFPIMIRVPELEERVPAVMGICAIPAGDPA